MGYATGRDYDRVVDAVILDGVNVVIWSFIEVVAMKSDSDEDENGNSTGGVVGYVNTNLNLSRIASLIRDLDASGHSDVIHLTSIGGWNGPHLSSNQSANDWYAIWTASDASRIFHGIDWDLEGNDDRSNPNNYFTLDCLDAMINISRLMKENGYFVTMAPPQSYLNFDDPSFGRYVNITKERGWHDEFGYFGNNAYAYLLLGESGSYVDLVSIQLYESYSNAAMSIHHDGTRPSDYLYSLVRDFVSADMSFTVNFGMDPEMSSVGSRRVKLDTNKLVIGLANGWALDTPDDDRTIYISGDDCRNAYLRLMEGGQNKHGDITPRGFMFWTIDERGKNGVYLARDIGKFLLGGERVSNGGGQHDTAKLPS
ncbi:hypothetical protein ACHAXA_003090 [Cyclostephanos tholiformis]|uniref:GH18 domain-containing protein n=1 Tax=Cyclostephanos tholiformis TaxID=382380 RepID=A0ABD3SSI3_9STRA